MPKKPLTAAEKRYRRWIILMPCEGCGMEDDTRVPHHFTFTTSAGMAQQAPDNEAVCLCYKCHSELHNHGERSFWRSLGRTEEGVMFWKSRERTEEELIEYANNLYREYYG